MSAAARKDEPQQVDPASPTDRPTYTVGGFVWAKSKGKNDRVLLAQLARIEVVPGYEGWHVVRCYYSTDKRKVRTGRKHAGGWSAATETRRIVRALTDAEIANLRKQGVIPAAGEVLS